MRPIPIPDKIRHLPWVEGTAVFSAPNGDLLDPEIPPAEGLFYHCLMARSDNEQPRQTMVTGVILELSDEDIELIKSGCRYLLMGWPGLSMPVFMVPEVLDAPE